MKIEIPGTPIAWQRPAQAHSGGKTWRYDGQKAEKETVRLFMRTAWNGCFDNPSSGIALEASQIASTDVLRVTLTFLLPVPRSDPMPFQNSKLWGLISHREKPDVDNLAKFYLDCGNGILWEDDKIINELKIFKKFSLYPRTIIEIMTKDNFKVDGKTLKILSILSPEKLKQMVEDAKQFIFIYPKEMEANNGESERLVEWEWQTSTARLLADFADKYSKELSLINKYKAMKFTDHNKPRC